MTLTSSFTTISLSDSAQLTGILFLTIFLRYLLISGVFHYLLLMPLGEKFKKRIINKSHGPRSQIRKEIIWSAFTSLIFSFSGTFTYAQWQQGHTAIYEDLSQYSWVYLPFSLIAALLIHETYYYWVHRWMHHPKIYRLVHKVHHDSLLTTSMTSFSFHPIESILQAMIVLLIIFYLPMHPSVLIIFLLIMTLSGTVNHAGIEFFPSGFHKHWLGKWLIGATHHDLHHKKFRFNFGLYFTFWDRWMGTESKDYHIK